MITKFAVQSFAYSFFLMCSAGLIADKIPQETVDASAHVDENIRRAVTNNGDHILLYPLPSKDSNPKDYQGRHEVIQSLVVDDMGKKEKTTVRPSPPIPARWEVYYEFSSERSSDAWIKYLRGQKINAFYSNDKENARYLVFVGVYDNHMDAKARKEHLQTKLGIHHLQIKSTEIPRQY